MYEVTTAHFRIIYLLVAVLTIASKWFQIDAFTLLQDCTHWMGPNDIIPSEQ
jgi:hypothetical protein